MSLLTILLADPLFQVPLADNLFLSGRKDYEDRRQHEFIGHCAI